VLGQVIGLHWHALVRDILALGYRRTDILTTLDLADMVAIVVGAGPNTSVRYFQDGGWNRTDHLLANALETEAGLSKITQPLDRPGALPRQVSSEPSIFEADAMAWEEYDELTRKRDERAAQMAAQGIKPTTRVRTI
jgi:hypothetical protein